MPGWNFGAARKTSLTLTSAEFRLQNYTPDQ